MERFSTLKKRTIKSQKTIFFIDKNNTKYKINYLGNTSDLVYVNNEKIIFRNKKDELQILIFNQSSAKLVIQTLLELKATCFTEKNSEDIFKFIDSFIEDCYNKKYLKKIECKFGESSDRIPAFIKSKENFSSLTESIIVKKQKICKTYKKSLNPKKQERLQSAMIDSL